MTAALSWPLQQALFARLTSNAALTNLLGGPKIYDAPPHQDGPGAARPPYILLGDETIAPWSDKTAQGAVHDFALIIISRAAGFSQSKRLAAAVSDALLTPPALPLARGRLIRLDFLSATASRRPDGTARAPSRRIELRWRAVLEDV